MRSLHADALIFVKIRLTIELYLFVMSIVNQWVENFQCPLERLALTELCLVTIFTFLPPVLHHKMEVLLIFSSH